MKITFNLNAGRYKAEGMISQFYARSRGLNNSILHFIHVYKVVVWS